MSGNENESEVLHLAKLCVGIDSVEALEASIERRRAAARGAEAAKNWHPVHVTRMFPRRAAALEAGGSLYWVIGGEIRARQRILALEEVRGEDGVRRCAIHLSPELVRTQPVPRRPFQGWRYLSAREAPPDITHKDGEDTLPGELSEALGLIGVKL